MEEPEYQPTTPVGKALFFIRDHKRGFINGGFFFAGVAATFYCVDLSPKMPKQLDIYTDDSPREMLEGFLASGKEFIAFVDGDSVVNLHMRQNPLESITQRHPL